MIVSVTGGKPAEKHSAAGDPWIQITFTIDTEHYRALRDRAEIEDLTVPGFVRESVIDSLETIRTPRCTRISLPRLRSPYF